MFVGMGANSPSGYNITDSLRLRSDASAYLTRTPSTAGNRRTWTYSAWIKRGTLPTPVGGRSLFYAGNTTVSPRGGIVLGNAGNDSLDVAGMLYNSATTVLQLVSTAQYRDPSAWYHIVVALDTTQATASNRCKVYVNGSQVTSFTTATYPSQNAELQYNDAIVHATRHPSGDYRFDGYIAENHFIDGQALTPSDFGEYNTNGVWSPIEYTGTYGTNGFYLNFSDGTSTTTLGYDYSGNSNNWTTNNVSLTAGATYDLMSDVPTLTDEDTANFATLNPNDRVGVTLSDGNLKATYSASGYAARGTIQYPSTGKWYYEMTQSGSGDNFVGLGSTSSSIATLNGGGGDFYAYYSGAFKYTAGSASAYGATYTNGDTIGVAVDADAGSVVFYKNGVSQGTAFTGMDFSAKIWLPLVRASGSGVSAICNFGQRPFAYTPPTGYKKLNTFNLPDSSIKDGSQYFDTVTYTGNGGTLAVTGLSFQPDWVWIKSRNTAQNNYSIDAVRGINNILAQNTTDAESAFNSTWRGLYGNLTAFNSNGFTVVDGTDPTFDSFNGSSDTYVAWNWRGSDSAPVSNTDGTITSTVSANTTSGFSVVTYTGTGANATVGHGLGVAPKMVIAKCRGAASQWGVYHASVDATPQNYALLLNSTAAKELNSLYWNNTAPTSTVISLGGSSAANTNGQTQVAYCFADVEGFSKFGSYTGNGSADGPFVYTGFRPAFVMYKRTDTTGNWRIEDTARDTNNDGSSDELFPNSSQAEASSARFDILSNGFKARTTSADTNASGGTYIYMAFAENPFKNSLAR